MTDPRDAVPRGETSATFPDVSGKWAMEIQWVRDQDNGRVEAEAFIRQNGAELSMTVRSAGSDSHTILVQPGRDTSGEPILYYMYEVEPRATHSDASGPYKGAAILRYYAHGDELSGNYWTSQRTSGRFKLIRKSDAAEKTMTDTTNVLLITAIREEYDEAKKAFSAGDEEGDGVREWTEREGAENLRYEWGTFYYNRAPLFSISMAQAARMGGIETGLLAGRLADRLRPDCVVMCGVCAGNPKDLALGDVVVSELAYQYDEGKREAKGFLGDHRQSVISIGWQQAAEALKPETMPSFGRPSPRDSRYWLLERLHAGDKPVEHPARPRYIAKGEWKPMIDTLVAEKIIEIEGTLLRLTPAGVAEVEHSLVRDIDPPEQLPFAIKVGPMASGNVVVKDGITWDSLKTMGLRSVIGLEMEAAAVGRAARASGVPEWIVVKGVMDYADPQKDDRYKPFAARASAEVLRAFLADRFLARPVNGTRPAPVSPAHAAVENTDGTTNQVPVAGPPLGGSAPHVASAVPASWSPNKLGGAFYEELRAAIGRNAPRILGMYDLALQSAKEAHEQASLALDRSDAARAAIGEHLVRAHQGKLGKKPVVLPIPSAEGSRPLIAKIWSSHDEYLGEASGSEPNGLGVLRAYKYSEELTPHLRASYAGQMETGKYGHLGVFTFFDHSKFAGKWVSGHPSFGYREYIGSKNKLNCDFYLGGMRGIPNYLEPLWLPHGEGIAVDACARRVRCGILEDGIFEVVRYEFDI